MRQNGNPKRRPRILGNKRSKKQSNMAPKKQPLRNLQKIQRLRPPHPKHRTSRRIPISLVRSKNRLQSNCQKRRIRNGIPTKIQRIRIRPSRISRSIFPKLDRLQRPTPLPNSILITNPVRTCESERGVIKSNHAQPNLQHLKVLQLQLPKRPNLHRTNPKRHSTKKQNKTFRLRTKLPPRHPRRPFIKLKLDQALRKPRLGHPSLQNRPINQKRLSPKPKLRLRRNLKTTRTTRRK